jgi:hypothetical protein
MLRTTSSQHLQQNKDFCIFYISAIKVLTQYSRYFQLLTDDQKLQISSMKFSQLEILHIEVSHEIIFLGRH